MLLKIFRSMSFVTCLMAASVAHGNDAPDPCVKRSDITDATLTLESSRLETSGLFIGLFRIENHDSDKAFHFRGFTVSGETRIVGPERSIEYLDGIAHEWRPVLDLPGTFPPRTGSFALLPGKTLRFAAPLFTSELADRGTRVFRLLIRSAEPRLCFVSAPFQAYPLPPAVKGFQSMPNKPGKR
jgi:hypothetical protein